MDETMLTPEDVAKFLNVNKVKVYDLAKSGKLKSHKIGSLLRFRKEEVLEFVNAN